MADDAVVILESGDKIGHVKIDDRILVQVLLERGILRYLQVGKEAARVARVVVVGTQHLGRHRLAEAAAARDAAHALLGEERAVYHADQFRLVNVLAVPDSLEIGIPPVDKYSHTASFLFFDAAKLHYKYELTKKANLILLYFRV
jgi:hypothetical protein